MKQACLIGLAAVVLGLSACAAPGYKMKLTDEQQARQPKPPEATLTPITPDLIKHEVTGTTSGPEPNKQLARDLAGYEYHVGPLDVLSVTVWDHPELTIPAGEYRNAADSGRPVNARGEIYFPYVGTLHVAGMTTDQIRQLLTEKLAKYIKDPQLDVRVAAFRSQRVHVTGEVKQPGIEPITDVPLTLLDAINAAGGGTELADLTHVLVTHGDSTRSYNVQSLLSDGNLQDNVLLRPGDIVHVPDATFMQVHLIGELIKPGSYPMYKGQMNLAEALGAAGGIDPNTANAGQIFVFRQGTNKPEVFWLNAESPVTMLLATEFRLQPQDVVYVASTSSVGYNRVIAQILPTIQALWQTAIIERELRRTN
ncbi:MAG: polysaccharide export protein [Gammaproteobacteria bacterium]